MEKRPESWSFQMTFRWGLCALILLQGIGAFAGPRVELAEATFLGSGCPIGSTEIALSKDAKKIEINFDKFSVRADNILGRRGAKKECAITFQLKVPHGFSVAVSKIKYNGIQHLPFGSQGYVEASHFFNHEPFSSMQKRYYGQSNNVFDISSHLPQQSLFWGPCGEDVTISSRTVISVSSVKSLNPASLNVDDVLPGLTYYFLWRPCAEQRFVN